jgi:cell division protein FtsQ
MRLRQPAPPPDLARDTRRRATDLTARRRSLARRRWLRRMGVVALAAAVVAGLVWLVGFSSVLTARSVEVRGVGPAAAEQVAAAAAVPLGGPLVRLDTSAVEDRVSALAGVESVSVSRSWPHTVAVAITPRLPLARVPGPNGVTYVDRTGAVFPTAYVEVGRLPELRVSVTSATAPRRAEAVAVLEELPPWLSRQVVAVEARSPSDVVLVLRDQRTVRWGSAREDAFKARVVRVLLDGPGSGFDVSVPDRPVISR